MKSRLCQTCGTDIKQFYKTGMLGCPDCYVAFRGEIEQTLVKIQRESYHVGKKPTLDFTDKEKIQYYLEMQQQMETASLEGRFADMTKLSLQLMELREELKEKGLV